MEIYAVFPRHLCGEAIMTGKQTKYLVVGGSPFTMYTGTTTYNSLRKLGLFNNKEEADKCIKEKWFECAGLIEVFEID